MDLHQIFVLALIALILFLLPAAGAYLMFKKAGQPGWKGAVPILNTYYMLEIAQRPKYWFFIQFIPVVGWFISLGIYIEFVKVFGKLKFYQHALTALTGGLYFLVIGLNPKDKFVGPESVRKYRKSNDLLKSVDIDSVPFPTLAEQSRSMTLPGL